MFGREKSGRNEKNELSIRAQLLISQVLGQIVPIAITPLLTRLVTPEQIGHYQLALSIALVVMPFAVLQADIFIPLARDAEEIRKLIRRAHQSTLIVGAFSTFAAAALTGFHGMESSIATFLLVVAMSLTAVTNASLIRKEDLLKLVKRNMLGGTLVAIIQIGCTALYPTAVSLGVGMLLGRFLCQTLLRSRENYLLHPKSIGAPAGLWSAISGASANALGGFASQMPMLVVAPAYGAVAAGHLGLGQRVVGAPAALIGQGVNQIFIAEAAAIIRSGEPRLWMGIRRYFSILICLSLLAAAIIAILAPLVTPWLFGSSWIAAGEYMQILALPMCLQFVAVPMTSILTMLEYQLALLFFQIGRILSIFLCIFIATMLSLDMPKTIALIAAIWTTFYIVIMALALIAIYKHDSFACNTAVNI